MAASAAPSPPHGAPLPPPSPAPSTLSARINAATRTIHHELNSLITPRLPLALPPHTTTPDLYLAGISAFAQLYFAFESSWQDVICAHLASATPSSPSVAYLATLVPPALWRTHRLEADIAYLRHARGFAGAPPLHPGIQAVAQRIQRRVQERPHLLLAYAWVLYMAIFAGGRWIRAQLQGAGAGFWLRPEGAAAAKSDEDGLGLWYFEGERDGEDVKVAFKEGFAKADAVLTETEKEEVVREAEELFETCIGLVRGLDERLGKEGRQSSMPEAMRRLVPKRERPHLGGVPGSYMTDGLSPVAALLAILLGLGSWWVLHSAAGGELGGLLGWA